MSKCTCFEDNLKLVKDAVIEQMPDGCIDLDVRWQNSVFFISGGDYSPVNPRVLAEYRLPKKGGGHRSSLKKLEQSLLANFCCYCGRKLNKNEDKKD